MRPGWPAGEGFRFMRLFAALPLPREVAGAIEALQAELRPFAPRAVRFTRPTDIHCTLAFLGEVPADGVPPVIRALETAAVGPAFELKAEGTGVFPNRREPRVAWLGLGPVPPHLAALHRRVESALEPLGFPPETREYKPHLTLARIKDPHGLHTFVEKLEQAGRRSCGSWRADSLVLYRSDLQPQGAVYTALHRFPLTGGVG